MKILSEGMASSAGARVQFSWTGGPLSSVSTRWGVGELREVLRVGESVFPFCGVERVVLADDEAAVGVLELAVDS